ncbi:MAG TPA: AsmA-like C-terminal region-containing protein, partial [Terriglobales bacterium]|nr:AsmA-like C-terminal region-containing protein [Terriglobales bacterium]
VPATITGDAQLKNVTAKFTGVAEPLRIASAHFTADKDHFNVIKATAAFTRMHSALEASASWPQHCIPPQGNDQLDCAIQFTVSADQLDVDEINSLLNPKAQKRPWYAAIANTVMGSNQARFPDIYALGQITAKKLEMKSVTASHFSSALTVRPIGFSLTDITADLLGGKFQGEVHSDLTGDPAYTSRGTIQKFAMTNLAGAMKDDWASGTATLNYRGQTKGWNSDDLLSSATGEADFEWHDGALTHIAIDNGKPLRFKAFAGKLDLRNGVLTVAESKMHAPGSIYLMSGTASLGRRLELKLARDGVPAYSVTGTLERPTVSVVRSPATQAKLSSSQNR